MQNFGPIVDAAAGRNPNTQDGLLARIVHLGIELEFRHALRLFYGPPGKTAGYFGDVLLSIAAVHAERVQFQQFASIVLIQPALAPFAGGRLGSDRVPIVEIEQHGGTLRGGAQQILELAEDVRANGIALICRDQITIGALLYEDIEVVIPEIREDFLQLAVAVDGAEEFGFDEVFDHHGLGSIDALDAAAQGGRSGGEELAAQALSHALQHLVLTLLRERAEQIELLLRGAGAQYVKLFRHQKRGQFGRVRRPPILVRFTLQARREAVDHHAFVGILGKRELACHHFLDLLGRGVVLEHLRRAHIERIERLQLGFQDGVLGYPFRM